MSALAAPPPTSARLSHQRRVSALLEELERQRRRLYVLQARGVRPAGLRDLKADLRAVRKELAATVAVGSPLLSSE